MSMETISDVNNTFLSRREIVCNFKGVAGKLKKLDAADMISKQFKLDGKVIIPIFMKTHSGKPEITGTFYVYDNEELAKKQVNPTIFKRLEKIKAVAAPPAEATPAEAASAEAPAEEKKEEAAA
ncbi:MAG: 30S ribosomal protein S24e [Nitrososphaerota archaeon]